MLWIIRGRELEACDDGMRRLGWDIIGYENGRFSDTTYLGPRSE